MLQQQLAGQVETGTAVELMWACAAARRPPAPRQLAAMVLQLTDALPDMGIGTFSRALWAASSLGGLQHPQQAEAVALSGQAAEVAAAAAAAAGGGCGCGSTTPRDLWLQHAFSDASAAALAGAGGNTLATLAHSLLLLQAPAPPAAWAAAYGAALGACAAELSIKQLQHVLAFLPALPSGPAAARLPQQLLAAAQQLLPVCNAPELAQLADGASLLAGAPPAGWAEAVTAAAARHADAMPADSAAQLLRALARSGASPPRHLLASLAAGTQAKLARAAPAARVELLLAFQHLSFRPAAAWVAALTGSFQAGSLQRLPGCQLAALGVGLARAGHAPGGAWMPAYLEAMGGKLQHLTPDRCALSPPPPLLPSSCCPPPGWLGWREWGSTGAQHWGDAPARPLRRPCLSQPPRLCACPAARAGWRTSPGRWPCWTSGRASSFWTASRQSRALSWRPSAARRWRGWCGAWPRWARSPSRSGWTGSWAWRCAGGCCPCVVARPPAPGDSMGVLKFGVPGQQGAVPARLHCNRVTCLLTQ